jgi:protein-S-isoprenylcysteine O-methyltransferase Ste14
MARDLERHGTLRRRTATAMWATYVAHSALTIRALYRPARPLPVPVMPAKLAGLTLTGAGLGLCVAGMRRFSGTHELTGTRNQPLTTTGIYRHSRNPQYLGYVIALAGAAVARRSPTALTCAGAVAAAYAAWIPAEERHLTRQFGQPYVDYVHRTHRWWGRAT